MSSKFLGTTYGNKATNAVIFPNYLETVPANLNRPSIDLTIALEPVNTYQYSGHPPDTPVTFNYGYTAATIASGALEYTRNGGSNWFSLNSGTPIKANELHRFRIDVNAGDSVNYRQTGVSTVQLKSATAHLNNEPL